MKILVIAAHPDDEVLGMGGTIKKYSKKGAKITLCVISEGVTAQYLDKKMIEIRKDSCRKSSKILGIDNIIFFDFPDMKLDTISQLEINQKLEEVILKINPDIVFTPEPDQNNDHRIVFESTLIATRPKNNKIKNILTYEIPSFSTTHFNPTMYENIENEFEIKIKAFKCYKTEIERFPHPRSIKSVENLAEYRGIKSGLNKAEAFRIIRKTNLI